MKWNHITECSPKDNEAIIQCFPKGTDDHHPIGEMIYKTFGIDHETYMKGCKELDIVPDFWWISSKDFSFPDQPERLNPEASKEDAIV